MKARYQYRIYPTDQQRLKLAKLSGCCRVVWNDALAIIKATAEGEKWPSNTALQKVHHLEARQRDIRQDFNQKLASRLVRENRVVVLEDLNVSGMVKNRALSRAISRAGWGQIRTLWEAKADMIHDREVRIISRWEATSQGCSCCGYRWGKLDLAIRSVVCLNCRTVHDRDVNASANIAAAGQAVPNGQTLSRVRPQSGAVAGLSTHQEAI